MPKNGTRGRKKPSYNKRRSFKPNRGGKGRRKPYTNSLAVSMPKGFMSSYNDFNPFPASMKSKLVYVGTGQLASAAGQIYTGSIVEFRLNSVYDPYTGVTASWNGGTYNFAKLLTVSGPYTRYKVNGCLVEILMYDSDGTDSDANELVIKVNNPSDTTTASGVVPYNVEKIPFVKVLRLANSGSQRRMVKQYFPMHQLFGMTKEQFRVERSNSTGPYNGNPASVPTMSIALANARGAATATTMLLRVKITYYVELYERTQDVY